MALRDVTPLKGKVAVVTGGAGGMGRAFAHRLAQLGAAIAIVDIDLAAGRKWGEVEDSVEAEVAAFGVPVISVQADLSLRANAKMAVAQIVDRFAGIDILINNAGGAFTPIERSTVAASPEQDVQALMGANFYSALHMLQEAIPVLTRPGASVVNVASVAVHGAYPDGSYAIYSAAKAAVVDLTIKLAVELGPEGIRVNAMAPGIVRTGRVAATAAARGVGNQDPAASIPLGRYGTVTDMANVIEFFATDLSQYVTGELLTVSGGRHRLTIG